MEVDHGRHKASKLASEDVIRTMPENVITNIMNHFPIQDAERTNILARNWRLKWTLINELVVDFDNYQYFVKLGPKGKRFFDTKIISTLILDIRGPVRKFSLDVPIDLRLRVETVNHWFSFLSRKGIEEFYLLTSNDPHLKLPFHLFSCLQLKHLALYCCSIYLPLYYHGFPSLLSLKLFKVRFESGTCGEFISRCPLLEIFILMMVDYDPIAKVNSVDIQKLGNIKVLNLPLYLLENMVMPASSIYQLLGFLPKLEELLVNLDKCKFVAEVGSSKQLPTAFPCQETLEFCKVDFRDGKMILYFAEMILCSPNFQTLYLQVAYQKEAPVLPSALRNQNIECSRMRVLQLRRVSIINIMCLWDEICLIKYLLVRCPYLEILSIHPMGCLRSKEKLMFTRKLLKLHRASPFAKVDFK